MDDFLKVEVNSLYYRFASSLWRAVISSTILNFVFGVWWAIGAKSWIVFLVIYGLLFLVALLYGVIKSLLEYSHLKYKLADQSLSFRSGLLSVSTTTVPYSHITNVAYDQGILARLFSVGDINIDQEDSDFSFKGIGSSIADKILDVIAKKSNIRPISSK